MNDQAAVEKARKLIEDVILVQGNAFIKELLLGKDIRGGVTKKDFRKQLDAAVGDGTITYDDLTAWIDDTEGWGDEHIYLYKVSTPVKRLLAEAKYAEERVRKAGFGAIWNADTSWQFPLRRTLTAIQHTAGELTCVWHQGTHFEKRVKEKDFGLIEGDGEPYFYRAWRIASRRTVTRIVIRPQHAAVFLPGGSEPSTHAEERASLFDEIAGIVRMHDWPVYAIGKAIKALDALPMRADTRKRLRAQNTRLNAKSGGWVEFGSDAGMSYADVASLRDVRLAVRLGKFDGATGEFYFLLPGQKNDVKVHLYGDADRIRLWVRLTRADVWEILKKIPKRSRP